MEERWRQREASSALSSFKSLGLVSFGLWREVESSQLEVLLQKGSLGHVTGRTPGRQVVGWPLILKEEKADPARAPRPCAG